MRLFSFRYKDIKGNESDYDIGVTGPNVAQDSTHRFVTDEEKKAWNAKPDPSGSASDMTVSFTQAERRDNLTPGEKLSISLGKIMKVIADIAAVAFSGSYTDLLDKPTIPSGSAAQYGVANNDTTTAAGYVADARIVKTHGDEIDQISSDLSAMNDNGAILGMDAREDGVYITYTPPGGADPVIKKLGEPTITTVEKTGNVTNGIYFDISDIEGFADLVLYQNLFPVGKTIYSSHTGASVGISITYNSDTGRLTMKGSSNGAINNGTLYIVQW